MPVNAVLHNHQQIIHKHHCLHAFIHQTFVSIMSRIYSFTRSVCAVNTVNTVKFTSDLNTEQDSLIADCVYDVGFHGEILCANVTQLFVFTH